MYELRWYQREAVESAWSHLRQGQAAGNPVIVAPTGSGKSIMIAELARGCVQDWNGQALILAHRKELLEQNAEKIKSLLPFGITCGIYSAGLRRYAMDDPIICCGIQSVYKKAAAFGRRHLVVVDEAHLIPSSEDGMYRKFLGDLIELNPKLRIIGLTATPYRTGEGTICKPDNIFHKVCYSVPIQRLIAEGHLCPITSTIAKHELDTSKLHKRGGEFIESEMQQLFDGADKVLAACQEIAEKTAHRKSTILFCAGVVHAGHVAEMLRKITGERTELITGETLPLERDAILKAFKRQEIKYLCNVDVLCLDEKTEILTLDGWVGIDDMNETMLIAAWETDGSIQFAPPQTIVRRNRGPNERMVSVKTNGVDIRVTSNHRMVYRKSAGYKNQRWEIIQAEYIVGKSVILPAHGVAQPVVKEINQSTVNHKKRLARIRSLSYVYRKRDKQPVNVALALATKHVDANIEMRCTMPNDLTLEECELIGFWIGDGSRSCGRVTIQQSEAYLDNISRVDSLLKSTGIVHSRKRYSPANKSKNHSIRWTLAKGTGGKGQRVEKGYCCIEPYLDKNGSELLWGLNTHQLKSLLHGFWLADGLHHAKDKIKVVACTNKILLDKLQAICTCRGIRTSITICSSPRKSNHSQQWKFSWSDRKVISIAKNRPKLETGFKNERVWCVTSSTGKLITRRNGKVAVVGNTTGFDAPCIDAIGVLRATASPGLFAQMVGRGFRTHEAKQDCLVLDFGENIKRHGPIDSPDYGKRSAKSQREETESDGVPGKRCPGCGDEVSGNTRVCECGYIFPANHQASSASDSVLSKPQVWQVLDVHMCRWKKRKAVEDAPDTLRVDYKVMPVGSEGMLTEQTISEWVCLEHPPGFALAKAKAWWMARSVEDFVPNIDYAVDLFQRGGFADTHEITTIKDGKFDRITKVELSAKPLEYLPPRDESESLEVDEWGNPVQEEMPF